MDANGAQPKPASPFSPHTAFCDGLTADFGPIDDALDGAMKALGRLMDERGPQVPQVLYNSLAQISGGTLWDGLSAAQQKQVSRVVESVVAPFATGMTMLHVLRP